VNDARRSLPALAATAAFVLFAAARELLARKRRTSLRDRVVLISGGGRGLGLALARGAAARGARIGLLARSRTELEAARDELRAAGTTVAIAVGDVRDDASARAALDRIAADLGPIDVLINVAGVIEVGPVDALRLDDYRDAVETNYLGAVRLVEGVRASMQARRYGRIVNIASLGGRIAIPHLLPYSASKFAILGYSEGLHAELARYGVIVTTVVPGLMRTGSPPQATFAGQTRAEYAMFAPSDSLPLLSVSVEHAARTILDACERGDAEAIVSWQARVALLAYRIAPSLVVSLLANVARFLPTSGGSTEHRYGHESESPLTRSPLDALGHAATRDQHEDLELKSSR
jgi:short-subunit dehydrogenase